MHSAKALRGLGELYKQADQCADAIDFMVASKDQITRAKKTIAKLDATIAEKREAIDALVDEFKSVHEIHYLFEVK